MNLQGIWKKIGGGYATFKRIRELENEKVLDVRSNVRVQDNFERLDKQVKRLKSEKEEIKAKIREVHSQTAKVRNCVYECIKYEKTIKNEHNGVLNRTEHDVDIGKLNSCFSDYRNFLKGIKNTQQELPENNFSGNFGEKIGWYERKFGLSATHQKIEELEKGKNLDVRSDVRVRDNLNRVRRQVFDLTKAINSKILYFEKPKKLITCLEEVKNFVWKAHPDVQVYQGEFYQCFKGHPL